MKYLYLLFAVLSHAACSKEEVYGPWNLKNGQEVEVLVSHRYGALNDQLQLLPRNEPGNLHLFGFNEREPGYNYRIKAKMVAPEVPAMDGPAYHLEFISVVDREKYDGNDSFDIGLIQTVQPGGPVIMLRKLDDMYYFIPEKISLTYVDEEVRGRLEELWEYNKELLEKYQTEGIETGIAWKTITATVTHDPENFGKSYLVSHIEFND